MSLVSSLRSLPAPGSPFWSSVRAEFGAAVPLVRNVLPHLLRASLTPNHTLLHIALENAAAEPNGLAFEMDDERLSWKQLADLTSRYARLLAQNGVRPGDNIVLMAHNSPRYVAWVLASTRAGATAALINYHLTGAPLTHALKTSRAKLAIVEHTFLDAVASANVDGTKVLSFGTPACDVEQALTGIDDVRFPPVRRTGDDDYVYIYTSGTTGLPKPCRISHTRAILAAAMFGSVVFELRPGDKLYAPLPLYHSSALLIGAGSAIGSRVPLAMREQFSASRFLPDVRRYGATALVYIGELCRYLMATPTTGDEQNHRLRVAVGNGLRPDVWEPFQARFGIPMIREFYTATEAPGALLNWAGVPGTVGRMPGRGMGWLRLAKFDVDTEEHVRDRDGFMVEADADEPGELLIRIPAKTALAGMDFRGYTDEKATDAKVLTNVFKKGDRYFRSGDLLRQDALGFYAFVDRIGDTFRCKGENVSTAEVSDVLSTAAGVTEVAVIGVRVAGHDGQFGLAAVVPSGEHLDLDALHQVASSLPNYAQPRFIRVMKTLATTSTHKHQKAALKKEGADPSLVSDPLYLRTDRGYVALTSDVHANVVSGQTRL